MGLEISPHTFHVMLMGLEIHTYSTKIVFFLLYFYRGFTVEEYGFVCGRAKRAPMYVCKNVCMDGYIPHLVLHMAIHMGSLRSPQGASPIP